MTDSNYSLKLFKWVAIPIYAGRPLLIVAKTLDEATARALDRLGPCRAAGAAKLAKGSWEQLVLPVDWANPDWNSCNRIHDWKTHIRRPLREIWMSGILAESDKALLAACAELDANEEEWD